MKKLFLLLFAGFLFTTACSSEEETEEEEGQEQENNEEAKANETQETPVQYVANSRVNLSIKGMMCSMNCVGSVKKALKQTEGVVEYTVNFSEENEIDNAIVDFDDSKTSPEEMVATIEALNDGIYSVEDMEMLDFENAPSKEEQKTEEQDKATAYVMPSYHKSRHHASSSSSAGFSFGILRLLTDLF